MAKWKYHVAVLDGTTAEEVTDNLNALGDQEWELVQVLDNGTAIYKREVAADILGDVRASAANLGEVAGSAAETVKGAAAETVGKIGNLLNKIRN